MEVSAGRWWWWGNLWKKPLHTGQRQVYVCVLFHHLREDDVHVDRLPRRVVAHDGARLGPVVLPKSVPADAAPVHLGVHQRLVLGDGLGPAREHLWVGVGCWGVGVEGCVWLVCSTWHVVDRAAWTVVCGDGWTEAVGPGLRR